MRAVDTNVLARLILADDEAQHRTAMAVMERPIWIGPTVWLELGLMLGKRLDRSSVADALAGVLAIEAVHTFDTDGLHWAIERYRSGADWADVIHLVTAQGIADQFATFDRGIGRAAGPTSPLPIETLA